ncbi:hypothetical protein MKW94_021652 [Papaver nudicaule]|uniref:RING-type domain-containing protein n=1 Tax=Papaver nudicaule TaxID=74823 RepID=A0AA41VVZ4_PAPNU|nr:hypothetical protein [Papaver nudicaule]
MDFFSGLLASESSFNSTYDSTIVSVALTSGTRIESLVVLTYSSLLTVSAETSEVIFDSIEAPSINELLNDELPSDTDESETTVSDDGESSIDELTNVLQETTDQETTTEFIHRSQYNSLPPPVQVLVNDLRLILLEDEQSEQVFAVINSTTNNIVRVLIFVQMYWTDVVHALDCRLDINRKRQVARSAVRAMTQVEITANDNPGDDPENKEGNEDTRCPICFDEWEDGDDVRETDCKHMYHASCIEEWLFLDPRGSCPICRFQIASTQIDGDHNLTGAQRLW